MPGGYFFRGTDSRPSCERGEDEIRVDEHECDGDKREGGEWAFEQQSGAYGEEGGDDDAE